MLLCSPCSLMLSCITQQISTHLKPLIWMVKWLHCWERAQLLTPYDQDILQRRLVHLNVNKILPYLLCSSFRWCWSLMGLDGSSRSGQLSSARVLLCIGAIEKKHDAAATYWIRGVACHGQHCCQLSLLYPWDISITRSGLLLCRT